jgi:glycerophosphoryl diester phosphodiesterase
MKEISPSYRELTYIAFAHRGARAYARENTLDAFQLGLRLGATGLESDVWITKDGVPVLDHDGVVQERILKRPISQYMREDLPLHIPTLRDLLLLAPPGVAISLDVKDEGCFDAVVDEVRKVHGNESPFIYLCHPDIDVLQEQRNRSVGISLVSSVRLSRLKNGPEMHAARMRELGIEVMNMHHRDWNGGLVALFHRFDVQCFAWDCQFARNIQDMARIGINGIFSDWPDRFYEFNDSSAI